MTADAKFVHTAQQDKKFQQFVIDVTPKGEVHQVWLQELLFILKLLWDIFQLLKGAGFFARLHYRSKVRIAMRETLVVNREAKLKAILEKLEAE